MDCLLHAGIDRRRSTQVPSAFLAHGGGQVACSALAVHCLPFGGQAKTLFGPFVGFDFRAHDDQYSDWG